MKERENNFVGFAALYAGWSLDILERLGTQAGGAIDQAAAVTIMSVLVGGALAVANFTGFSASGRRKRVTRSKHEGRLAPRRHLGSGS